MTAAAKKLTQPELEALRTSVPHATMESIGAEAKEGVSDEFIEDLQAYLYRFAAPKGEKGHPCLRCDKPLVHGLAEQFMGAAGGFEWGIAHGHGHCRHCGWPATLYHFVKDRDGKDLVTFRNILLQAHPDNIELRKPAAS